MASHPVNLGLRFILEMLALAAYALWGWGQPLGILWAIGIPLLAAVLWGTFRADDPIHHQEIPVKIPGWLRLALEALIFGGAVWALYAAGQPTWGMIFAGAVIGHYLVSYDRVWYMLGWGK